MQHRICQPVLFKLFHGEPFEEFALALEVGFNRGYQQALAETAGTAQEVISPGLHQAVDNLSLINVEIPVLPKAFKVLYTDGIDFATHGFLLFSEFRDKGKQKKSVLVRRLKDINGLARYFS